MSGPAVKQSVCLVVIDGWGVSPEPDTPGDAIENAATPVMDAFLKTYPKSCTEISAHGLSVGLPDGLMGNSEVGHLNIGAGRVVYQDIVRIELAIKNNTLKDQPHLKAAMQRAKAGNGRLHLMGLVSDGGVHAHIRHLFHLLDLAKDFGIPQTYVHVFGDGRDTAPKSAVGYLTSLIDKLKDIKYGSIADVTGRYYAMDRDKRWERVKLAYDMLVEGKGEAVAQDKLLDTVQARYDAGETDEFLKPIIVDKAGHLQDNDTVIMFNFRSDRMRQLASVLGEQLDPMPLERGQIRKNLSITTMSRYNADFPFPLIFPPQTMSNVLSEWLAEQNVPQMHVAETEKYAHVTFFFNGGTEAQFRGEERTMVDSPKVATYDLKPEMNAEGVAQKVAEHVLSKKYPFVMCNFAPPDMVGHTGKYQEAIKAVEATDRGIGVIYEACKKAGCILFVTSDHGNAEKMISDDGKEPHTAHTTARVPFVMASKDLHLTPLETKVGALCDVAPTVLQVMGLPIPAEMTGSSLLVKSQ